MLPLQHARIKASALVATTTAAVSAIAPWPCACGEGYQVLTDPLLPVLQLLLLLRAIARAGPLAAVWHTGTACATFRGHAALLLRRQGCSRAASRGLLQVGSW